MMNEHYYLHQTPPELAKELIKSVPIGDGDFLLEPFRGERAFYDNFPENNPKDWCEITEGFDYKDYNGNYDWVITNPPFQLEEGTKRINAFWLLLDYYSTRAKKGIAFLANERCFSTLTPRRLSILKERGWYIHKIVVCSVKKWRGRYFFIVFTKQENPFYDYLLKSY